MQTYTLIVAAMTVRYDGFCPLGEQFATVRIVTAPDLDNACVKALQDASGCVDAGPFHLFGPYFVCAVIPGRCPDVTAAKDFLEVPKPYCKSERMRTFHTHLTRVLEWENILATGPDIPF
ncbi:hypothetical protein [Eilatimonas milleporae]|uniref:Uncharacterized protein n=1 Tax=Eilatimonas milleporae TaxID=911205 RepID=A0A3M0CHG8_9PROT|nr:hypothetical protein [Eilatimonas milleporae]RMB09038.1 hypothetical protein BXY39_1686 [Eilatimonas milleporae]